MPGRGGIQLKLLKELMVKHFHAHLHVDDLQTSIAFYSQLFSAQPIRVEADYAKGRRVLRSGPGQAGRHSGQVSVLILLKN
jgi:predicted enzyme related to lactoylglutathione lyase